MLDIQTEMQKQIESKQLFEQARSYAYEYMDAVRDMPAFPCQEAVDALDIFQEPIPGASSDASHILELLHKYGSPATVAQTAGRYFGFVDGGAVPVAVAVKWLSDVWDQNTALYVISPIASKLEEVCEHWLAGLLGLPEGTAAGFVSGSSTAIICGLGAARDSLLRRAGWDVSGQGLFGAPEIKVVLGEQAHSSVFKALSLLGLGRDRVIRVPVDEQGRMRADRLPELDNRTLVVLQAGNVNSGAFDPIGTICDMANGAGAWVHVDGAFGLWAAASESRKQLTAGMDKADSWSTDAHKTLNTPYDCGIILCKDRNALISAMQATGSYIQYSSHRDGMLYTPEMSRRARSVELWATLKYLGRSGVGQLVDGLCERADQFARLLEKNRFSILNDVVFNQVLVSCGSTETTNAVLAGLQQSGECWCGGTSWKGEAAIRVSVCSWATTEEDIDRSVKAFVRARDTAL